VRLLPASAVPRSNQLSSLCCGEVVARQCGASSLCCGEAYRMFLVTCGVGDARLHNGLFSYEVLCSIQFRDVKAISTVAVRA